MVTKDLKLIKVSTLIDDSWGDSLTDESITFSFDFTPARFIWLLGRLFPLPRIKPEPSDAGVASFVMIDAQPTEPSCRGQKKVEHQRGKKFVRLSDFFIRVGDA